MALSSSHHCTSKIVLGTCIHSKIHILVYLKNVDMALLLKILTSQLKHWHYSVVK